MKNKITVHISDHLYFGGDRINGVVELNVQSEIQSKGVGMFFVAYDYSSWNEGSGNGTSYYSDRRVFLKHKFDFSRPTTHLTNTDDVVGDLILPGVYRYPFSLVLPKNLPASCEFLSGGIRYTFCAYVERVKSDDLRQLVHIRVGGELFDRVLFAKASQSITLENEETFLFSSGKMKMTATVPKNSLYVGDVVPIHLLVDNNSGKKVDAVKVYLVQHCYFYAHGYRHEEVHHHTSEWQTTYKHKINERSIDQYDIEYVIPQVSSTITSMEGVTSFAAKLVFVGYKLVVKLHVPFAMDLEVKFTVHIMLPNPHVALGFEEPTEPVEPALFQLAESQHPTPPQPQPAPRTPPGFIIPVVEGYEYPHDTQVNVVDFGFHEMIEEEVSLLN